jgi:hypothetical protein
MAKGKAGGAAPSAQTGWNRCSRPCGAREQVPSVAARSTASICQRPPTREAGMHAPGLRSAPHRQHAWVGNMYRKLGPLFICHVAGAMSCAHGVHACGRASRQRVAAWPGAQCFGVQQERLNGALGTVYF